jgi:hypothetical protein
MKNSIIVFAFLFFACRKTELNQTLPYSGDKLVVFAFFSPSNEVSVYVSKTYPPSGQINYIKGIDNAEVLVFENDLLIEKLTYDSNGNYKSKIGYKPKIGNNYKIKVTALGYPEVYSNNELIPTTAKINKIEFKENIESKLNQNIPSKKLILTLKEFKELKNFYSINVIGFWQNKKSNLNGFSTNQPNGVQNTCNFNYLSNYLFNDECTFNEEIEISRGYETSTFFPDLGRKNIQKAEIRISQISESYYLYSKTFYTEEDLVKAFITPNARFNNIKNGYGIFATFNETIISYDF